LEGGRRVNWLEGGRRGRVVNLRERGGGIGGRVRERRRGNKKENKREREREIGKRTRN
jgi:hypothetical protein